MCAPDFIKNSTTPARRPASVALAASAAANQGKLAAFGAGVAFVAFHAGLADALGQGGDAAAVLFGVAVASVAVARAVARHWLEMLRARRHEGLWRWR